MIKNSNLCVDLKTVMQNDALPIEGQCYNGVLTRDGEDHFIFEESCHHRSCQRNPKLFDGQIGASPYPRLCCPYRASSDPNGVIYPSTGS